MPWWFADEPLEDEPQARRLPFGKMVRRVAPLFRPHIRSLIVGVLAVRFLHGILRVSVLRLFPQRVTDAARNSMGSRILEDREPLQPRSCRSESGRAQYGKRLPG